MVLNFAKWHELQNIPAIAFGKTYTTCHAILRTSCRAFYTKVGDMRSCTLPQANQKKSQWPQCKTNPILSGCCCKAVSMLESIQEILGISLEMADIDGTLLQINAGCT